MRGARSRSFLLTRVWPASASLLRSSRLIEIFAGLALGFFECWQSTKRAAAGAGPHAHAVLSGDVDKSLGKEAGEGVDLQLFEQVTMFDTEVCEHVIVGKGRCRIRRRCSKQGVRVRGRCEHSWWRHRAKGPRNLWIAGVAACDAFDGVDWLVKTGKIETEDELPNTRGERGDRRQGVGRDSQRISPCKRSGLLRRGAGSGRSRGVAAVVSASTSDFGKSMVRESSVIRHRSRQNEADPCFYL